MADIANIRSTIALGLKNHLGSPVIRSNQTGNIPDFPYSVYTITLQDDENKGTWQQFDDNTARKTQILSFSFTTNSDDYDEAVETANKARNWFDYVGKAYLDTYGIIVKSVGSIADRSSLLSADYMYSYGFDCFIRCDEIIEQPENGTIENIFIEQVGIIEKEDKEATIAELQKEVDIANATLTNSTVKADEILALQEQYIGGA